MRTPDVNVLVDVFREDSPHHRRIAPWFRELVASPEPFALFELVLSGFLRVVTHPRVFDPPAPLDSALEFVDALLGQPSSIVLRPGPRHWSIFTDLCHRADSRGNLVADAFLAALALEAGCTLVTSDRDFARFPELRWQPPGEA